MDVSELIGKRAKISASSNAACTITDSRHQYVPCVCLPAQRASVHRLLFHLRKICSHVRESLFQGRQGSRIHTFEIVCTFEIVFTSESLLFVVRGDGSHGLWGSPTCFLSFGGLDPWQSFNGFRTKSGCTHLCIWPVITPNLEIVCRLPASCLHAQRVQAHNATSALPMPAGLIPPQLLSTRIYSTVHTHCALCSPPKGLRPGARPPPGAC